MSEKMMITFVETDDLFFPCIVYSMLIFWQKCKFEICQLEDGKSRCYGMELWGLLSNSL